MALEAEALVDRRRLKRRLAVWRILAIMAALLFIAGLAVQDDDVARAIGGGPHIARIEISGIVTDDEKQQKLIDRLKDDANVRAVILDIDSPGGTTTGAEALFQSIRHLAEKKPVVAVCGTMATSAAYLIALASDRIFVRGNTITGSIGVIFQWAEVDGLLDKLGIKVNEVRSGPLKAVPSPFEPLDPAGRALTEELVKEAQGWFFGLVSERRKLDIDQVPGLKDGRVFSGRQAVDLKLADQIGGKDEAEGWLKAKTGADLKVKDWKPDAEPAFGLFGSAARALAAFLGLPSWLADLIGGPSASDGLHLDGLASVWHPRSE